MESRKALVNLLLSGPVHPVAAASVAMANCAIVALEDECPPVQAEYRGLIGESHAFPPQRGRTVRRRDWECRY